VLARCRESHAREGFRVEGDLRHLHNPHARLYTVDRVWEGVKQHGQDSKVYGPRAARASRVHVVIDALALGLIAVSVVLLGSLVV
jgi:hypothetical protein